MSFTTAQKSYYDQEYTFKDILLRLWTFAVSERRQLLLILILFLINTVVSIIVPLLLRAGIDEFGVEFPNFNLIEQLGWRHHCRE